GSTCMTPKKEGSRGRRLMVDGSPLAQRRGPEHRLSSLCAQRSCTPLRSEKKADKMSAWRTGHRPVFHLRRVTRALALAIWILITMQPTIQARSAEDDKKAV